MAILQQIAFIVESYRIKNHLIYTNNSSTFEYLYLCLSNAWYQNKYNYINSCFLNYYFIHYVMHAWLYFAQIIWFIIAAKSYNSCWHPCNYCRPHLHFNAHKQYEKNKDSLWLIRCFFNVFEYAYWNMNHLYSYYS